MTYPSSANPNDSSTSDDARFRTLLDNLNNLRNKLRNFTVIDELGQPIGEIRDLILDNGHQLNLVISKLNGQRTESAVLLNGRRIKKVSVQTQSVFVDITKLDTQFLPEYSLSENSTIAEPEESKLFIEPPPTPKQSAETITQPPQTSPGSMSPAGFIDDAVDSEPPETLDDFDIPVAEYLAADELAVSELRTPGSSSQDLSDLDASVEDLPLEEEFTLSGSPVDDLSEDLMDWEQESDGALLADFDLFRDESSFAESLETPIESFHQAFPAESSTRPPSMEASVTESRLAEELSELDLDATPTEASADFNLEVVESPLNLDLSFDDAVFPSEESGKVIGTDLEGFSDNLSTLDRSEASSVNTLADFNSETAEDSLNLDLLLDSDFLSEESDSFAEVSGDQPAATVPDLDFAVEDNLTEDLPALDLSLDKFATSSSDEGFETIGDASLESLALNEETAVGITSDSAESWIDSNPETIANLTDLDFFQDEGSSLEMAGLRNDVVDTPQPVNLDLAGLSDTIGPGVLTSESDRDTSDDTPDISSSLVPSEPSSELARRDSAPLDTIDQMVPLLEERLQVEYQRRKIGEVIVRKKIETRMVQVPVRYEKLVIEQISPERKSLAEIDLSQGEITGIELPGIGIPGIGGSPTVSGTFKSPKTASYVLDAIAKTLRHRCKSVRIEIELEDGKLQEAYQEWIDQCSRL